MKRISSRFDQMEIEFSVIFSALLGLGLGATLCFVLKGSPQLITVSCLSPYLIYSLQPAGSLERSYRTHFYHCVWCAVFIFLVVALTVLPVPPLLGVLSALSLNTYAERRLSRELTHGNTTIGLWIAATLVFRRRYQLSYKLWDISERNHEGEDYCWIIWLGLFFVCAPILLWLTVGGVYALYSVAFPSLLSVVLSELFLRSGNMRKMLGSVR